MLDLAKRTPDTFLEQGDVLFTPQEQSKERLFILKKGRVQLYEISLEGEEITLSVVEDGNIFGEMILTGQNLVGAYVRALAPWIVVSLKREDLEKMIIKNPEVGLRLVHELAGRLHASRARFAGIVGKDVPARLATLILTLVETEGEISSESYRIPTRYTLEQLGSMIGCKRVAVTRAFSQFKKAGVIQLKDRHIIIKSLDALQELAA